MISGIDGRLKIGYSSPCQQDLSGFARWKKKRERKPRPAQKPSDFGYWQGVRNRVDCTGQRNSSGFARCRKTEGLRKLNKISYWQAVRDRVQWFKRRNLSGFAHETKTEWFCLLTRGARSSRLHWTPNAKRERQVLERFGSCKKVGNDAWQRNLNRLHWRWRRRLKRLPNSLSSLTIELRLRVQRTLQEQYVCLPAQGARLKRIAVKVPEIMRESKLWEASSESAKVRESVANEAVPSDGRHREMRS